MTDNDTEPGRAHNRKAELVRESHRQRGGAVHTPHGSLIAPPSGMRIGISNPELHRLQALHSIFKKLFEILLRQPVPRFVSIRVEDLVRGWKPKLLGCGSRNPACIGMNVCRMFGAVVSAGGFFPNTRRTFARARTTCSILQCIPGTTCPALQLNGLEVLEAVESDESTRAVPVLIVTSSRKYPDINRAYEPGANGWVVTRVGSAAFCEAMSNLGL